MKKTILIALAILFSSAVIWAGNTYIAEELPKKSKKFLKKHFADQEVVTVDIEKEDDQIKYEVNLANGTSLEFNEKGNVQEIESESKLPDSVIPRKIRKYVTANYPEQVIVEWEIESPNQHEVELDNGIDLEFDKRGNFLQIE